MATEASSQGETSVEPPADETSEQQEEQESTLETGGQEPTQLPADHPLVKTMAAQKAQLRSSLADLNKERKDSQTAKAAFTELTTEVEKLRPVQATLDAVQARYDRLEEFLQAVGGPMGKALDSKTFTTALFETTDNITDIVKKWNVANPTATSTALGSGAAAPADKAPDINALLRAAIK